MLKFVLAVALFAAAVYGLMWALEKRRAGRRGSGGPGGGGVRRRPGGPPQRPVAPDDDEDFLRWLDRKRKRDSSPGSAPDGE